MGIFFPLPLWYSKRMSQVLNNSNSHVRSVIGLRRNFGSQLVNPACLKHEPPLPKSFPPKKKGSTVDFYVFPWISLWLSRVFFLCICINLEPFCPNEQESSHWRGAESPQRWTGCEDKLVWCYKFVASEQQMFHFHNFWQHKQKSVCFGCRKTQTTKAPESRKDLNWTNSFPFCSFAFDYSSREPVFCQTRHRNFVYHRWNCRGMWCTLADGQKREEKKTQNSSADCFSAPGVTEGKNVNAGCEKLKRGERGSTVLGEKPWGSEHRASTGVRPRGLRPRGLRAGGRTIWKRLLISVSDGRGANKISLTLKGTPPLSASFSLFQLVLDPAPVPSIVPAKEKNTYFFSLAWQWQMPSQEAERCLAYLVKGGEWAAALDSVTFWPSGKFLGFFFSPLFSLPKKTD